MRKKRVLIKRDAPEPEKVESGPKPIIDAAEIAVREGEARKQAELAARQADDVAKKRKKEADAEVVAKANVVVAAPASATPATPAVDPSVVVEGTIHKPAAPAGEAVDKAKKGAKKPAKQVVWQDPTARKRTIKTRGDASGGLGWRDRKVHRTSHKQEGDQQQCQHRLVAPDVLQAAQQALHR